MKFDTIKIEKEHINPLEGMTEG